MWNAKENVRETLGVQASIFHFVFVLSYSVRHLDRSFLSPFFFFLDILLYNIINTFFDECLTL